MFKISLMDQSDLEEAFKIEQKINPSPWSKENFYSSLEVGHNSLICKADQQIAGFIIFSTIKRESHLLNIAVLQDYQRSGAGSLLMASMMPQVKVHGPTLVAFLRAIEAGYPAHAPFHSSLHALDVLQSTLCV